LNFVTLHEELTNSTAMIRSLLAGLTQEEARFKPTPETWSILEVTCHLYDEEQYDFRARIDVILNKPGTKFTPIHPGQWVTERKYNEQNFSEVHEKFFNERMISLDWLEDLAGADWDTPYQDEHGTANAGEFIASWIAHDNLHIRQLVELRRAHIEQISRPYPIEYAGEW
jgi:hypothetical protein